MEFADRWSHFRVQFGLYPQQDAALPIEHRSAKEYSAITRTFTMVGKVLAQYQIVEKLGEGGMGVVWKARDTHLDRFVALKTLSPERLADPERKRRFVQEAKAASALNHPNIVHVYDIADADGIQFIAMEYVPGKTLDQLISRKGLRLSEVLKYAVQIAEALAKAHSAGIIHRDLKPSNVMVTENALIKVLDFGLAKLAERATGEFCETATVRAQESPITEEGTIVGTVAYMSPEQAEAKKVDARSDIFSFGSMLYEMVTGRRAFHGDSKLSTLSAILKEDPKPVSSLVPDVPRDLEKIILHCLRKDPERRFQHMDDLKLALLDLKEESDSGKLPAIAHAGIGARSRKSRLALGVGLLSLFVIALGAFALWFSRTEPPRKAGTRVVPVTNYPGAEIMPTFSPDGRQIAFFWNGENKDHRFDLYVKLADAGEPVRLTTQGAWWPAWSPDGRFIAFERQLHTSERSTVFVVPALRGAERKLAEVYFPVDVPTPHPAWTPDSKWLIVPDRPSPSAPFGLVLLSVESGVKRQLTRPPPDYHADGSPSVSPDGRTLAFARRPPISGMASLWLLALSEDFAPRGEPKQLTSEESELGDLMWAANGREVLYVASSGVNRILQRVAVSGARPARTDVTITLGPNAFGAALSAKGDRLAYSLLSGFTFDVYRFELAGAKQDSRPLITSSFTQGNARISPDGRRIAFASDRSGSMQIWVCDSDGSNAVQLTSFGTALTGSPHWSPDGREIAFNSSARGKDDIYVIDVGGGKPRRLTDDPASHVLPSWSRDGRWIYFASNRTGGYQVWKMPAMGGPARQVTSKGSAGGLESSDGKWLYFARNYGPDTSIWKVSAEGGDETAVVDRLLCVHNFDVVHDGIYFVQSGDGPPSVRFYRFATGKLELVAPLKTPSWIGLSVSPDRRWMLVTQKSIPDAGDLMLIENFR